MIRMKCPTCAKAIGIDEAYIGKPALCPGCHAMFTVPAPAVLLEDTPAAMVPLSPVAPTAAPADPGNPLLPDGLIPLAPEPPPPTRPWSEPGDRVAPAASAPEDPWLRTESRLRPVTPEEPPPVPAPQPERTPVTEADLLPPPGEEVKDWNFLSLDLSGAAPAAAPPPPLTPTTPPPLPPAPVDESGLILLPEEEPEPLAPFLLPPSEPAPSVPLTVELVLDDEPAVLPALVEPASPPLPISVLQQSVTVPVTVVPSGEVVAAPPLLPLSAPPPVPVAPRVPAPGDIDWGADVNRQDVRERDRDPLRRKRRRRSYGAVTLVPGLDDFYLGLIVLGAVWLILAVMVMVSPRLCMVPIIVGGLIWVCSTFWLNASVSEADPFWKIPFLAPVPLTPIGLILREPALVALGFVISQAWATFFALYFRDRALRAFVVTWLALLISGMGWAAMPRTPRADGDAAIARPALQDFGP